MNLLKIKPKNGFRLDDKGKTFISFKKGNYRMGVGGVLDINITKDEVVLTLTIYDLYYKHGDEESDYRDSVSIKLKTKDISIIDYYAKKLAKEFDKY